MIANETILDDKPNDIEVNKLSVTVRSPAIRKPNTAVKDPKRTSVTNENQEY